MTNHLRFELSCRLLQRRVDRLDTVFQPLVSAVLLKPYTTELLLITPNQPTESETGDWSFPSVPLRSQEKVNDTFSRLVTEHLGIDPQVVSSVTAIQTEEFATVGASAPGQGMNFYVPLLGTVAGRPSVQLNPSVGACAEWFAIDAVPEILAGHSSIPERDAALAILDEVVRPK